MTDKETISASTQNHEGYRLYASIKDTGNLVFTFVIPKGIGTMIDQQRVGMMRIDKNKPIDVGEMVDLHRSTGDNVWGSSVSATTMTTRVGWVDQLKDGSYAPPLEDGARHIFEGHTLLVRYYVLGGTYEETSFDLEGISKALHEADGIPATVTQDDFEIRSLWSEAYDSCPEPYDEKNTIPCAIAIRHCLPLLYKVPSTELRECLTKRP